MNTSPLILLLRGLDILVLGIEMAPAIRAAFQDLTAVVAVMVSKGRDPTADEWGKLDTLQDAVHAAIQEAHP